MNEIVKKIRIDVMSLMFVVVCIYLLGMLGVGISFFLLLIYMKSTKTHYLVQKILLCLCFLGIVLNFCGLYWLITMENTGIDGIGEALIYSFIVRAGRVILTLCPIILLIIDNRKFIFKKNVLVTILLLVIACFSYFTLHYLFSSEKVGNDIPTVMDFEKQLIQRGLKTHETDYRLYGINNKSNKAIALSFEENTNDKYPLYVYSIIDFPWIIYYANGEIYAVRGKYWDEYTAFHKNTGYNEEKIIWNDFLNNVIKSESKEISVYNRKRNRYEKGNIIISESFNYYSKDKNIENSIFIDIPSIGKSGLKIEQVDKIDINSLKY